MPVTLENRATTQVPSSFEEGPSHPACCLAILALPQELGASEGEPGVRAATVSREWWQGGTSPQFSGRDLVSSSEPMVQGTRVGEWGRQCQPDPAGGAPPLLWLRANRHLFHYRGPARAMCIHPTARTGRVDRPRPRSQVGERRLSVPLTRLKPSGPSHSCSYFCHSDGITVPHWPPLCAQVSPLCLSCPLGFHHHVSVPMPFPPGRCPIGSGWCGQLPGMQCSWKFFHVTPSRCPIPRNPRSLR